MKQIELKEYQSFLNSWEWEWFVTLNLKSGEYSQLLKSFIIRLCITEKIQICHMGVLVYYPQHHLHLLMKGRNRSGKCLHDVSPSIWERVWSSMTHQQSVIAPIYDKAGVISYVVKKNMGYVHHEKLPPYNMKFLKQSKIL